MRLFLFIFYLITVNVLFAQDGVIQGTVQDSFGEPLWGSNVYLVGTSFGASTDSTGFYRIDNIPIDKYTLVCDYIGYRTEKKNIYISEFDVERDTDRDQTYLEKIGLEQEDNDFGKDIVKGKRITKNGMLVGYVMVGGKKNPQFRIIGKAENYLNSKNDTKTEIIDNNNHNSIESIMSNSDSDYDSDSDSDSSSQIGGSKPVSLRTAVKLLRKYYETKYS